MRSFLIFDVQFIIVFVDMSSDFPVATEATNVNAEWALVENTRGHHSGTESTQMQMDEKDKKNEMKIRYTHACSCCIVLILYR